MIGRYDYPLVALSWAVAVLAAAAFLDMTQRLGMRRGTHRLVWQSLATVTMALGVWAMHFIGMLAWQLPIAVTYDTGLTLRSIVPAIVGSGIAVEVMRRGPLRGASLLVAGLMLGTGIGAMHYSGMSAIEISPSPAWDVQLVALSLVIAVVAATFALRIAHGWLSRRAGVLGGALVLGSAIAAMHYVGMAAIHLDDGTFCIGGTSPLEPHWLAVAVALGSAMVISLALVGSVFDGRLHEERDRTIASLRAANEALEQRAQALAAAMTRELAGRSHTLQRTVSELENAQADLRLMHETSALLQSVLDEGEANRIVAASAQRLFPSCSGALSRAEGDGHVRVVERWNAPSTATEFEARDCSAWRLGKTHRWGDGRLGVPCAHMVPGGANRVRPHVCVPIIGNGEVIGALHLVMPERSDCSRLAALPERDAAVAAGACGSDCPACLDTVCKQAETLCDTAGLALSNMRLRASLHEQANRDVLTGLYNRRHFDVHLGRELARAHRDGSGLTLALLDVDHFKRFNDEHGHDAGDAALRAVGAMLREGVRSYDFAARWGGEEFAIVFIGGGLADAADRVRELARRIASLACVYRGQALPRITVSAGLAEARGGTVDDLIRQADAALYRSKSAGRDRVTVHDGVAPQAFPAVGIGGDRPVDVVVEALGGDGI